MATISSEEALNLLSKKDRAYVKEKGEVLIQSYKALTDIRAELGMTQNDLADNLEINQKNISNLEKRSDMKLSTLRSYLHALGGELIVSARFPDQRTKVIESLSD